MSFKAVAIVSVKGNSYRIHSSCVSKNKVASLIKKTDLNEKSKSINKNGS